MGCQPRVVVLGAVLVLLLVPRVVSARTWRIKPDGTGDAPTIQAGIDSAATMDTILVNPGTYDENLNTNGKGVVLQSAAGPEGTIMDGGRRGRVMTVTQGAGAGPVISGFTLRNGQTSEDGGGVWIGHSGTILRGNVIEENTAGSFDLGRGGGVFVDEPTTSCLFEENTIRNNYAGSSGGGIVTYGSEVRRNIISGNGCHVAGGGGIAYSSKFIDNLIVGNFSDSFAGAMWIPPYGELLNNTIVHNRIANTDQVALAVLVEPFGVVRNNIIVHNTGGVLGASQAAGIQCGLLSQELITIACNDVWGNDVDEIRCCCAWPDNFSADPLFCDEAGADFHISENSPCAAATSGACGLVGSMPPACRTTAVQKVFWSRVKCLYR